MPRRQPEAVFVAKNNEVLIDSGKPKPKQKTALISPEPVVAPKTPKPAKSSEMALKKAVASKQDAWLFTVQLGSFSSELQVRKFSQKPQLHDLKMISYPTRSKGETWHALTWGEFESREAAESAWQERQYPELNVWIRSRQSLTKAVAAYRQTISPNP